MVSLRDKLIDVIAEALPETPDMLKFCESDEFSDMLDKVVKTIVDHILEEEE